MAVATPKASPKTRGRPPKLDEGTRRRIALEVQENPEATASSIVRDFELDVRAATVRNFLRDHGAEYAKMKPAPALTASHKKASSKKPTKKRTKVKAKNSEVAVGRWAKWRVYNGWKARTTGRLTKKDLKLNRRGRVVYKKLSANMKQRLQHSNIKTWYQSVKEARQALMLTGFVPVGGKTAAGKALLLRAKVIYYERVYNISQRASEEVLSKQIGMKSPASPTLGALSSPEIMVLPGSPQVPQPTLGALSSPEIMVLPGSPQVPHSTDEAVGA
eukprot:symbB.v1.2.029548.t2/scaffold3248.1/size60244/2